MNILFQTCCFSVGGVERVTVTLANEFVRRGHAVCVSAFFFEDRTLLSGLDPRVELLDLSDDGMGPKSRAKLRAAIRRMKVDVVVNQWCVLAREAIFLRRAMSGSGARLVAVHHTLPTTNMRIRRARNPLSRFLWKVLTALDLRLVYALSDRYVLLSETFVPSFRRFLGLVRGRKLAVIANPLTLAPVAREKENLVVYVGRLSEMPKRVSRVIEIWRRVAELLPDWKLEIVGDGPDRARYEAEAKGLPRIAFAGCRNPAENYARAKLSLLTSDLEGFPLVLVEAMASKCVPIVLGSYAAVADLASGCVVEPMPFDAGRFADDIRGLASDSPRREQLAAAGEQLAAAHDVRRTADRWEDLFRQVCGVRGV